MKDKIFRLNPDTNHLEEQPEMKEPDKELPFTVWEVANGRYREHIASLKTYPISGIIPESWKTGRDIDASEFKIECMWGKSCSCGGQDENCRHRVAISIYQKERNYELLKAALTPNDGWKLKEDTYGYVADLKNEYSKIEEILLAKAKELSIYVDFSDKSYDGDKEAPMDLIGFLVYLTDNFQPIVKEVEVTESEENGEALFLLAKLIDEQTYIGCDETTELMAKIKERFTIQRKVK